MRCLKCIDVGSDSSVHTRLNNVDLVVTMNACANRDNVFQWPMLRVKLKVTYNVIMIRVSYEHYFFKQRTNIVKLYIRS